MSKHEVALAMIDEKAEKLEKDLKIARGSVATARGTLERAEKEVKLIEFSIKELDNSRSALVFDRSGVPAEAPGL